MEGRHVFRGKPYRAAPALGEDKWSIYAYDDHRQERYLGNVTKQGGSYRLTKGKEELSLEEKIHDFEAAVATLYQRCVDTGYLTQGHENYLGGREDEEEAGE